MADVTAQHLESTMPHTTSPGEGQDSKSQVQFPLDTCHVYIMGKAKSLSETIIGYGPRSGYSFIILLLGIKGAKVIPSVNKGELY